MVFSGDGIEAGKMQSVKSAILPLYGVRVQYIAKRDIMSHKAATFRPLI
jgi:hypothetical protein